MEPQKFFFISIDFISVLTSAPKIGLCRHLLSRQIRHKRSKTVYRMIFFKIGIDTKKISLDTYLTNLYYYNIIPIFLPLMKK